MSDNRKFWNRYSGLYDFEINRFNKAAYEEMYRLMSEVLKADMRVLEVATGTGLITLGIAEFVRQVEATDFSPKMIETANALHIMPDPEAALESIRRVLKPGGLLIAPTFAHGHLKNLPGI